MTTTRFWAIADTHLTFGKPKNMSRFGSIWVNHTERLATQWRQLIAPEDVVMIPGDISWANKAVEVQPDLAWLTTLPGRKVLVRGNHDHWWKRIDAVRNLVEPLGFYALDGDCLRIDGVILCGAMGHVAPHDPYYRPDPPKNRYTRELERLRLALETAKNCRQAHEPVILIMHYPPFTSDGQRTAYVDLISAHRPAFCLYGHLHRDYEWAVAKNECFEGVSYALVAADFLEMTPRLIWPNP